MADWPIRAAEACVPLFNLVRDEILDAQLININETPLQVLNEPNLAATTCPVRIRFLIPSCQLRIR